MSEKLKEICAMRPPVCEICGDFFDPFGDEGGLLTFRPAPEDKEQIARLASPGFVGHPPHVEWFCPKHFELAKRWSHLTLAEARKKWKIELS